MTTTTPMRECCANAARKYLERCADLGTPINYADLTDAVLAEFERPSGWMIQAATDAYEEWCLDEDTFSAAQLAELMLAAAIRAAREGK